jgi:hypothetical protein
MTVPGSIPCTHARLLLYPIQRFGHSRSYDFCVRPRTFCGNVCQVLVAGVVCKLATSSRGDTKGLASTKSTTVVTKKLGTSCHFSEYVLSTSSNGNRANQLNFPSRPHRTASHIQPIQRYQIRPLVRHVTLHVSRKNSGMFTPSTNLQL